MISKDLIAKTFNYFNQFKNEKVIVNPSIPILYFGDLDQYLKSPIKIITVGKNPSNNEFRLKKMTAILLFVFQSGMRKRKI